MYGITPMVRSPGWRETTQTEFGGYDRRAGAPDGALFECLNMCADKHPALTLRPRRGSHASLTKPNALFARDCLVWVDGDKLIVDGAEVGTVTDGPKQIAGIQKKLCIWPDKVMYDRESGELASMEASWSGDGYFSDGTLAGESALANTLMVRADLSGLFRAGDGVTVEAGGVSHGAFVIQEMDYDGDRLETHLRFPEETWREFVAEPEEGDTAEDLEPLPNVGLKVAVTIRRTVPELDMVFEHHNRLWGARGSTVYASKLGDPANWQVFDGLSTDSYELTVGSPGDITGCCAFGGRPVFFKEREIIRVYGDTPDTWQLSTLETLGVERGSSASLAVAGETLFYKSPAGIRAYNGGYTWDAGEALGEEKYRNACAGSDGVRYFVCMEDYAGERSVFVYDTRHRVWHQEDGELTAFGWHGELYALDDRGWIKVLGDRREQAGGEEGTASRVETSDFTEGTTRKKGVSRVVLRLAADELTTLDIFIRYDSDGEWVRLRRLGGGMVKGQVEVPIRLRRCDHYRLRIDGLSTGGSGWTLYALTRERRAGSNRK